MKTFVNMLPQSYRRQNLVRLRFVQWAPVWILVFAGAASAYWTENIHYKADLDGMRMKERRYAPVEKLSAELGTIRLQLTDLQKQEAVAAELVSSRPVLSLVGVVSRSARECGGNLRVSNFKLQAGASAGVLSGQRPDTAAATTRLLVLEGTAQDNLAVPKFVALLRRANVFERVELKSSKEETSQGDRGHSFHIECSF